MIPSSALALAVAQLVHQLGGRPWLTGVRRQEFTLPGGLHLAVAVRPHRCTVAVDRLRARTPQPPAAPDWIAENVAPIVRAADPTAPLPTGRGTADEATVPPTRLLPLLEAWLPAELDWQRTGDTP